MHCRRMNHRHFVDFEEEKTPNMFPYTKSALCTEIKFNSRKSFTECHASPIMLFQQATEYRHYSGRGGRNRFCAV